MIIIVTEEIIEDPTCSNLYMMTLTTSLAMVVLIVIQYPSPSNHLVYFTSADVHYIRTGSRLTNHNAFTMSTVWSNAAHSYPSLLIHNGILQGWSSNGQDLNVDQWIQYDLGEDKLIYSIETKCRYGWPHYYQHVKKVRIYSSSDGSNWHQWLVGADSNGHYTANSLSDFDYDTSRFIYNNRSVRVGRYVKVYPEEFHDHITMRMEVWASSISTTATFPLPNRVVEKTILI